MFYLFSLNIVVHDNRLEITPGLIRLQQYNTFLQVKIICPLNHHLQNTPVISGSQNEFMAGGAQPPGREAVKVTTNK